MINKIKKLPIIIEQDENDVFVAECPVFRGCYTQGDTMDEVMQNIKDVIKICMEEAENKAIVDSYKVKNLSFSEIAI